MRKQFKDTVMSLAEKDKRIILLFGDISVYLFNEFRERYPGRFYNAGICENTLISMGAGLSSQGLIPFVHSINPFITERSLEQIKIDLCYNGFGCNIVSCGASFDYAWDGATHHSYSDIAILRLMPGIEVMQPGSRKELDILMRSRYDNGSPKYFRLSDRPHDIDLPVKFGEGIVIKETGSSLTVMTAGPILANVFEACKDLDVNLVYFHTIKPIDKKMIGKFKDTDILVVHDAFGLREAVSEVEGTKVFYHGLNDEFIGYYGTLDEIRRKIGLDANGIREKVRSMMKRKS